MEGSCEHGNEHSDSIQYRDISTNLETNFARLGSMQLVSNLLLHFSFYVREPD
jgi:hypothetical protein